MPESGDNEDLTVRTTITIDDELLERAAELVEGLDRTALLREALKALIERESARRLARLGGTEPGLKGSPRRRVAPKAGEG